MAEAADLLDEQVDGFGRSVGGAALGLRDWSDPLDAYEGNVYLVLLADLYPQLPANEVTEGDVGVVLG